MALADGRRTGRYRRRRSLALVLLVAAPACSSGGETAAPTFVGVPETVAIGGLPGPLSDTTVPTLPDISIESTTTTVDEAEPITGPLVDEVLGHRVLLIGDTALAATTSRAGGIMCDVVTGFGWDIDIEAEPGRPLSFADEVLDELLADDWDVVGLMFGHHLEDTVEGFEQELETVLDRLSPRPVILITVAELGEEQVEVNRVLRAQERSRPNVVVLDWAEATSIEPELLLDDGGPGLTEEGSGRLALFTAAVLSSTPGGDPGTCIEPVFTDDSAIVL